MLLEIFLVRVRPVLGNKDPAHVHRGEPTSCRKRWTLRLREVEE